MEELPRIHWLASYPKSGNTWVRALLYAYEFGNISLAQMHGHISGDQAPGVWFASSPVPWGFLNNDQRLLLRYPALMTLIMTHSQETIVVKTHSANLKVNSVDMIPEELTGSSVYLVRDPRDVAISYAHHMGIDIDESIDRMGSIGCALDHQESGIIQALGTWSVNVKSWHEDGHFPRTIVRYEDLLTNPEEELAAIIKCIYVDEPDMQRVKNAVEICEFDRLKRIEEKDGFREASQHGKFFRKGKSTWRDILTYEQVDRIEQDHGEWMYKLGYEFQEEFKLNGTI